MKFFAKCVPESLTLCGLVFFLTASSTAAQTSTASGSTLSRIASSVGESNRDEVPSDLKVDNNAAKSTSNEFRIGPGDLLDISVFEAPELNRTVRVENNSQISLPLVGEARAADLTPRELESVLQELLRRTYIKDPHVSVFVRELESHPVSVVGAVKQPGVFQIRGTKTVIEMLSMAQGLTDDAGDTVLITHGAGSREVRAATSQSSSKENNGAFRLTRAVPDKYDGPVPADQETSGQAETINLKKLLDTGDPALNASVGPGDIVKVPRAEVVYVVGEVGRPGGFVLQSNGSISVLQALALAGGPTHTSALSRVRIIRMDASSGKRTEIPINLGKILSGKSPDTILEPKDIVFIPNNAAKSALYRASEAALQTATGVAIYRW